MRKMRPNRKHKYIDRVIPPGQQQRQALERREWQPGWWLVKQAG